MENLDSGIRTLFLDEQGWSYYDIFDVINITIYLMLFIVIYSEQFYIVRKKCVNFVPIKIEYKENKVIKLYKQKK